MSSSATNMVANSGSKPLNQGTKVKIQDLNSSMLLVKPLVTGSTVVQSQVEMRDLFKNLHRIFLANGLGENELNVEWIKDFHAQVLAFSAGIPRLDEEIQVGQLLVQRVEHTIKLLGKEELTLTLLTTTTTDKEAKRVEMLAKVDEKMVENNAKVLLAKEGLLKLHNQSHAFKIHLATLTNLAEINDCMLLHLCRIIPQQLKEVVLQQVENKALSGTTGLGMQFKARSSPPLGGLQAPKPIVDIWSTEVLTRHKVLESSSDNLTQWLRFLIFWETRYGITSPMQLTEFKKSICEVNDDTKLLPNFRFEDWFIQKFLPRTQMFDGTDWAFSKTDEIILFINLVNNDDLPRFKNLVTAVILKMQKFDYAPTRQDLDDIYDEFKAADMVHWLQEGLTPDKMQVNAVWNKTKKVTQATKLSGHGGPKSQVQIEADKRIICAWCLRYGHIEKECNGKKNGKPKKEPAPMNATALANTRVCWECGSPDHNKVNCPVIKAKVLVVATGTGKAKATGPGTKQYKKARTGKVDLPEDDAVDINITELSTTVDALTVSSTAEEIIIDSGSQVHCLKVKPATGFVEQVTVPMPSLKFGNGQELSASSIGSLGNNCRTRNAVVCSGLTKNLLSVTQLTGSGVTVVSTEKGCYLVKGKVTFKGEDVMAFAPLSNGLYHMPLSSALEMLNNI